ncbi:STAS/SEC14 domain-containing protein [Patescibacteria group bacterium]
MFKIMPGSEGDVVGIKASGTLVDKDYKELIPKVEKIIEEKGDIKVLLDLLDMEGFTAKALMDDMNFCIKYKDKMKKIAIVAHSKWEKECATLCKPFMPAEMKYFDIADEQAAWDWLRE